MFVSVFADLEFAGRPILQRAARWMSLGHGVSSQAVSHPVCIRVPRRLGGLPERHP